MKNLAVIFFFYFVSFYSFQSFGSYLALKTEPKGAYFGEGYTFSLKNSEWKQILPQQDHPSLKAVYKSPSEKSSLTLRESQVSKKTNLKKYVKSWIKDYRTYGLHLINSKPIKINKQKGILINSEHKKSKKVFRQIVFLAGTTSVVLTCKTDKGSKELIECAELIKNFKWTL